MFSLHSREISLGVRTGSDFNGDEGMNGTLDGDVTRVRMSFTGDSVSL